MKLKQLKKEIQKYQYLEDTKIIDISLASVIATRLKLGDPLWLIIIGASSGGKSQIIRPLALADTSFIHRIDDLTENTLLSGMKSSSGEQMSLLGKIGSHGMLAISDLTVLFSKSSESRATILSQFRMLYDGEMIKHSGNSGKPISWKGYLGVISGSTPSIYNMFEEVSDMGERFIYYRMKEYNAENATRIAMSRSLFGKELDEKLSSLYSEYVKEVCLNHDGDSIELSTEVNNHIIEVASFAERVRTVAHVDKFSSEKTITRIPVPAMPMRVALQLATVAKALIVMKYHETGKRKLTEDDLSVIDWAGYSLANEEKRRCLSVLASIDFELSLNTSTVADQVGLDTSVIKTILQNLSAVGVVKRGGGGNGLNWSFMKKEDYDLVRRIENMNGVQDINNRDTTEEEIAELEEMIDRQFDST